MESILQINIPVQMISCTDTNGRITPIRFRFRDKDETIVTVTIDKILQSEQNINRIGAEFQCEAFVQGMKRSFTLSYNYAAHEWHLSRIMV